MPLGRTQCREQSLKVDRKKSKKAWYNLNTYASVSKILRNNIRSFGGTSSFKVRNSAKMSLCLYAQRFHQGRCRRD